MMEMDIFLLKKGDKLAGTRGGGGGGGGGGEMQSMGFVIFF